MTNEEREMLKEELKQEVIEELRQEKAERLDASYVFKKEIEKWCQEQQLTPHKVKDFVYQGVKYNLKLKGINWLDNQTYDKALEIFDYLKPLILAQF